MADIVNFPVRAVRDWLIIERSMNAEFVKQGVPPAAHARMVDIMREFWEVLDFAGRFDFDLEFPRRLSRAEVATLASSLSGKITESVSRQLSEFTNKLFFERFHRELDVCRELGLL